MTANKIEDRSIIFTIVMSVTLGLIAIAVSLITDSGVVFLDGSFSLVFALVGLLTLYVSRLVRRPGDEQYPFGYATFEPMLNLFKGLLIATVLLYAVWNAVTALMGGGRNVSAVGAIIYAVVAVTGGTTQALVLRKLGKQSGSPIVQLDARNAVVDTMLSAAVGIAFVITLIIQNSGLSEWAPYADPVIMLVIVVIALPQPFKTIRANWRQLLGSAPDRAVQDKVAAVVESALERVPHSQTNLRTTHVGRYLYVHLYVVVPEDAAQPVDVRMHDRIRSRIYDELSSEFRHLALDLGFTTDVRWAISSVPSGDQEAVYPAGSSPAKADR